MWRALFALAMAVFTTAWPSGAAFQADVIRISDGDTIVVRTLDAEDIKIRLYGIDAPEHDQPGGQEAAAALRPLLGRTVTVREMDTDDYSRIVALVEFEGNSVNLRQVEQGRAWHYGRFCLAEPICQKMKEAEAKARQDGLGLWQAPRPTPPWNWRRK